jgi:hypothetical protein
MGLSNKYLVNTPFLDLSNTSSYPSKLIVSAIALAYFRLSKNVVRGVLAFTFIFLF